MLWLQLWLYPVYLINQIQLIQMVVMLLYHLMDNKLIQQDKLTTLLMANLTMVLGSLTTVLSNQITLLDSLFILIKGISNLQCKELQDKGSLVINTNNHSKIDK